MAVDPMMTAPPNPAVEQARLATRLQSIVVRMEAEANRRVGLRQPLEEEWLLDARQCRGRYDEITEKNLRTSKKSQLNINLTQSKTNAWSGWLMDLLFPTDDKNWGIGPTPVPELTTAAEEAGKIAFDAQQQLEEAQKAQEGQPAAEGAAPAQPDPELQARQARADAAKRAAAELQLKIEEGRRRAALMEAEIDDQLKASSYHAVKRDQIEDACKYGTGVTKGPVTGDKVRKGWQRQAQNDPATGQPQVDDQGQPVMGSYALQTSDGDTPTMRYVDLWAFFPDPDAKRVEDGEGVYERHLLNPKKLRALQHLKGFRKDAIARLLQTKPRTKAPSYLTTLRNIGGDKQQLTGDLYHVWEYSGCLDAEDMRDIAMAMGDEETVRDIGEIDPLLELNAIVWFCDGEILKFSIYPYDSGECMYSVFNFAKDETSIFGYGVPATIRDPQRSLNSAWRAMMDNAGYAVGPQIGVRKSKVEPENGQWTLGGGAKVWLVDDSVQDIRQAFSTFDIPIRQVEYANIIALSKQFIDDMAEMPQLAQGEQGTGVTKTAQGMAILMNSNNVVKRRVVRSYDDDVTVPDIRRFYDWNMQFNPKEDIKGDYGVDARGSSVLLIREMQAQTLMAVATQLGAHPVYGPMLRNREVLRKLFQALGIPSADVVLSDNEIDAVLAASASDDALQQAEMAKAELEKARMELEATKLDAQIAMANMENESQKEIALITRETELIKLAQTGNMSLDALEAKLQMNRENNESRERALAAEIAVEDRNAERARQAGQQPTGSGGSISAGTVAQ